MRRILVVFAIFYVLQPLYGQKQDDQDIVRKSIIATRSDETIKIDGVLDEPVWETAQVAENFIERNPHCGKQIPPQFTTKVKILYDDSGVYFGAQMNHPDPKNIEREMMERDKIGNSDLIGITINGNNDHQQSLMFLVQASGVQADAKIVNNSNDDYSWNAVWYSNVKITDKGWTAEIKIPYSELRFSKNEVQTWGLNFLVNVVKTQSQYTWNGVDNKKGSFMLYDGVLSGIQNIDPPTRLSFMPYFSSYYNHYHNQGDFNVSGGMDLKYGISDAFTLDMTLIPDFGQASFDDAVLNLGPFEQQFDENRSFFMEGTELFNKGGLFYSRRVGGAPSVSPNFQENEVLSGSVEKVKLFNAVKISGRTKGGLGIGLFNGVTEKTHVTILDTEKNTTREQVIEPWANYNVLVLDQRFSSNSSVTLVNTNVTREGSFRDANVSALLADITNKKNTVNYFGNVKQSIVNDQEMIYGTEASAGIGKISGKHRYGASVLLRTEDYNIDDLGYTGGGNFIRYHGDYSFRYLEPKGTLNNLNYQLNVNYTERLEPQLSSKFDIHQSLELTNRKFETYGLGLLVLPFGENNFYEPRTPGYHLGVPMMVNPWIFYNSDSRKKFRYWGFTEVYVYDQSGRIRYVSELNARYRISDRFSIGYELDYDIHKHDQGFVDKLQGEIYIGERDVNQFTNGITSQYIFSDKMSLNLDFRHYYSSVKYHEFFTLANNGDLTSQPTYNTNRDGTYNFWNIDLRFSWWFAPGSQLSVLYRNALDNYVPEAIYNVRKNFSEMFDAPMLNTFSLKLTYFLDYNRVKRWIKK